MGHRTTDWASEAFMVMQPFVAPGPGCYEATFGLRAINCSFTDEFVAVASKAWGALVLERHCNVSRHARTAATACTQTQCNRQVMAVKGAQGAQGIETKRGHKLFCSANKGINSQEITPGWNSHQCFVTSLRGSAQILQQTEQRRAILGYISPSVLQCVSCRNANCPLSLRLCTAERVSFLHSASTNAEMCVNKPHDQVLVVFFVFFFNKNWTGSSCGKYVPLSKNGFDAHIKYLSSLRSLPRPISTVPHRRCVHPAYVTVPKALLKKTPNNHTRQHTDRTVFFC